MGKQEDKTNAMRILDQKKIPYGHYSYECGDSVPTGTEVAAMLGLEQGKVFKTLVTVGKSGEHYVFVIPVAEELDLKAAASAAGEKNIEMVRSKDLLSLTGYIHGGCSPIGMKKYFNTVVDSSAKQCETIVFSAGRIGRQIELKPEDLEKVIRLKYAQVCK